MKIKLTQTTVKFFIVTAINPTAITLYGGTDYAIANAAITGVFYSGVKAPFGFPAAPEKWAIEYTSISTTAVNSPAQNTWYNVGSFSMPTGDWIAEYSLPLYGIRTSVGGLSILAALSTANNTAYDIDLVTISNGYSQSTGTIGAGDSVYVKKPISVAAKTTYYINISTQDVSLATIKINSGAATFVRLTCAYL
jgi:hypothetical protein